MTLQGTGHDDTHRVPSRGRIDALRIDRPRLSSPDDRFLLGSLPSRTDQQPLMEALGETISMVPKVVVSTNSPRQTVPGGVYDMTFFKPGSLRATYDGAFAVWFFPAGPSKCRSGLDEPWERHVWADLAQTSTLHHRR